MKRFAALGAIATISLLAGCATGNGYYSEYGGAYGYGGYPAYAGDYGYNGYAPYYDDYGYAYGYGYPYAYGPTLGFSYYDFGGFRGDRFRGERRFTGSGRPSSPPASGLGPQGVGPQARSSGAAVAPNGGRPNGFMGRRHTQG